MKYEMLSPLSASGVPFRLKIGVLQLEGGNHCIRPAQENPPIGDENHAIRCPGDITNVASGLSEIWLERQAGGCFQANRRKQRTKKRPNASFAHSRHLTVTAMEACGWLKS